MKGERCSSLGTRSALFEGDRELEDERRWENAAALPSPSSLYTTILPLPLHWSPSTDTKPWSARNAKR